MIPRKHLNALIRKLARASISFGEIREAGRLDGYTVLNVNGVQLAAFSNRSGAELAAHVVREYFPLVMRAVNVRVSKKSKTATEPQKGSGS